MIVRKKMPLAEALGDADDDDLVKELEYRGYEILSPHNQDECEYFDPRLLTRAVEYARRGSLSLAQFYLLEAVPGLHALRATLQPV